MTYPSQIPVTQALELLQEEARTLPTETVPLTQGLGRTLARALRSRVDHPSLDNSALDGYACRAADTAKAAKENPVTLRLVGDIPAGSVFSGTVGVGEAVGIYTGAPIPEGADAIIGVELTERTGERVRFFRPASPKDIRPRAQDLRVGEVYLEGGQTLTAAAVAVAAAMGHAELPVVRRPRVGILATGDELVEPGEPIQGGQVYNSNLYGLAALVAQAGGEAVRLPNVRDDLKLLEKSLSHHDLDLLLTSGGVSMGRYDFVRDLLFDKGRVHFWKVAMKPGGPVLFGAFGELPVLGLPGNPVSSLVVFQLLGRAFLAAALDSSEPIPYHTRLPAVAETPFAGSGFKETFARATLRLDAERGYLASSTGSQSSGVLRSLLLADALAVVPPHTDIEVGGRLEVISL
jgi:molybdopterin molybdotransferase